MTLYWNANGVNNLKYYLESAETPGTPESGATVTVTIKLGTTQIGAANRSMPWNASLRVSGKTGGYALQALLTAAEITAAGQNYTATIVAQVGGVTVDTMVLTIPCRTSTGGTA